jgi:hypothetical protein
VSDINKQLVRLGSQQPHLRPHIRAVLAAMESHSTKGMQKAASLSLKKVAPTEAKIVNDLINRRITVDWVSDPRDSKYREHYGTEYFQEALEEFVALNEQIEFQAASAAKKFKKFFNSAVAELAPYGLEVRVGAVKYNRQSPSKWADAHFDISLKVTDNDPNGMNPLIKGVLTYTVELYGNGGEVIPKGSDTSRAFYLRHHDVTAGDMILETLKSGHSFRLSVKDIEDWKASRLR